MYVDDLVIFDKNKTRSKEVIELVKSKFEIKEWKIKNFLGAEFEENKIYMHQKKYIKD